MNILGRLLYIPVNFIIQHTPGWHTERVRIVFINDQNEVLMVKSWLSRQLWTLPGGGIKKGENPVISAVRELKEETGINIDKSELKPCGDIYSERMKANLTVFTASTGQKFLPSLSWPYQFEIIDRNWFPLSALPTDCSTTTKNAVALALKSKN